MKILVTGSAGFIGFHLCNLLIKKKINVIGIDNLNKYYDIKLKKDRTKILKSIKGNFFRFIKLDISDNKNLKKLFLKYKFTHVVNLAAQAGVRYSITNPEQYIDTNINGFYNILHLSKVYKVNHFIYASSSSVYGNNNKFPLRESYKTDSPLSLYAASKKSNEVLAYSYSNIFKLPTTGLRFFTVYGPYGRPDMALYKFVKNIIIDKPIELYNSGDHFRDFTYVDNVVDPIYKLIKKSSKNSIPYQIFNIANGKSVKLIAFVKLIEKELSKKALIKNLKMQIGDVKKTHADISKLKNKIRINKRVEIKFGIKKFVKWYKSYYKIV
jgi:UDP-glucuronate 4-epimerase